MKPTKVKKEIKGFEDTASFSTEGQLRNALKRNLYILLQEEQDKGGDKSEGRDS